MIDGRDGQEQAWFDSHFHQAASECVGFLGDAGVSLIGKRVCDIGCGDGLIDVGVINLASPAEFVGFDIAPGDLSTLRERLMACGERPELLDSFTMRKSEPVALPWRSDYFDVAISWSAFEHVSDPEGLLRDVHRVLSPGGIFFLQLWPFYWSEHGTHLWQWFPEGYANQRYSDAEIRARIADDSVTPPEWKSMMLGAYETLNKITVHTLEQALLSSGFEVRRFQLLSDVIHVPEDAPWVSVIDRAISGVKLVAVKAE